jgi:ABC-type transport system involved in multi-copper enzyme maturation permease subunit
MKSIWQTLAWKEWHEHKWKLAAVTAILLSVLSLCYHDDESTIFSAGVLVLVYGMVPIALFLAASDAGGESTRGTLRFTQALPVSMPHVAAWKFALGLVTCIAPILITIGAILAWYLVWGRFDAEVNRDLMNTLKNLYRPAGIDHDITVWLYGATTIAVTAAASIYIWTLALGVNQRTEVRAGAVALLVGVLLWAGFLTAAELFWFYSSDSAAQQTVVATASIMPGGFPLSLGFALFGPQGSPWLAQLATMIAAAFHLILIASFVYRFGSIKTTSVRSRESALPLSSRADWLPQPFRSPLRAVLWKQWRESGPIVMFGMLALLAIVLSNFLLFSGYYLSGNRTRLADLAFSISIPIGFVLALCVGITNFDQDMTYKISEFWRSRPIRVDAWFWTKFLAGLLGAVFLPAIVATVYVCTNGSAIQSALRDEVALMMLSFYLAIYAAASATIIVIRQPIYAAILGIGALLVGIAAHLLVPGRADRNHQPAAVGELILQRRRQLFRARRANDGIERRCLHVAQ